MRIVQSGRFQCGFQRVLSLIPNCIFANANFGAIRKLDQDIFETDVTIDTKNLFTNRNRLGCNLFRGARDMGVILRERTHPEHTVQCAGRVVPMYLAEFGKAIG